MKKELTFITTVSVEIKDDKIQQVLKDFRECIKEKGTINDVFAQIGYNEVNGGGFCEGVGENGQDFEAGIIEIDLDDSYDID